MQNSYSVYHIIIIMAAILLKVFFRFYLAYFGAATSTFQ